MKPLTQEDLLPLDEYERQREALSFPHHRAEAAAAHGTRAPDHAGVRESRNFAVSDSGNDPGRADLGSGQGEDELDVYNALLPAANELSATLLIEITEADKMKEWLDRFMGLDHGHTVAIMAGGESVFGQFEGGHSHETKISAVHFVRFRPARR